MIKALFSNFINKMKSLSIYKKIILGILLLIYLFMLCISVIKVDYVIVTPGLVNDTSSIIVKTENERGIIGTVGVYEYIRPSVVQYWAALCQKEMTVSKYNPSTDLDEDADYIFGKLQKQISLNNAVIAAYTEAMKTDSSIVLSKTYKGVIVSAVLPSAVTDLKPGDVITKVNGNTFANYDGFKSAIQLAKTNDSVSFTVLRINEKDNKEYELENVNANFVSGAIGIIAEDYWIVDGEKSTPQFTINYESISSIGSSGGAMTALGIYNSLTSKDITKVVINNETIALKITGTGTITANGVVGRIGGVKQKVLTAYKKGLDVFFVDAEDYQDAKEAMEYYDISDKDLKLIKVNTLTDIINALETWGE